MSEVFVRVVLVSITPITLSFLSVRRQSVQFGSVRSDVGEGGEGKGLKTRRLGTVGSCPQSLI